MALRCCSGCSEIIQLNFFPISATRKHKLEVRSDAQNQEAFGDAIRAGNTKAVRETVEKHWPECLSYSFSFNIHFRRIGTEPELARKSEDMVDGGKVSSD